MTSAKQREKYLERVLREAYAQREAIPIGDQWPARVIDLLREQRNPPSAPRFSELFGQFTWRLAPYVCLLTLALTAFLIADLTSGDEAYQFLANGLEEISLTQIF